MFKKRSRATATRQKDADDDDGGADEEVRPTEIAHATKQQRIGRAEPAAPKKSGPATAAGPSGGSAATTTTQQAPSRPEEIFAVTTSDTGVGADKLSGRDMATRTFNVDADHQTDQRAINERNAAM